MIWFNLKKLEKQFVHNQVSEEVGYQYLLAWTILLGIALYGPTESDFSDKVWELSDFVLDMIISITGIWLVFKINRNGTNLDFLKRFFSLGFVISIRLAVLFVLLHLIFKSVMYVIPNEMFEAASAVFYTDLANLLFNLGLSLLYYFLMVRSFKRINNTISSRLKTQWRRIPKAGVTSKGHKEGAKGTKATIDGFADRWQSML